MLAVKRDRNCVREKEGAEDIRAAKQSSSDYEPLLLHSQVEGRGGVRRAIGG
jgi:hypothetical protein